MTKYIAIQSTVVSDSDSIKLEKNKIVLKSPPNKDITELSPAFYECFAFNKKDLIKSVIKNSIAPILAHDSINSDYAEDLVKYMDKINQAIDNVD